MHNLNFNHELSYIESVEEFMYSDKNLFIFDMDGVIYKLDHAIPHAIDTLHRLRNDGKKIAFFTNNSSKTPKDYLKKLHQLGFDADESQFFTSGLITALHLESVIPKGKIYVIGMQGLRNILKQHGFSILNELNPELETRKHLNPDEYADAVVVGWDTDVTYSKLRTALMFMVKGAPFYATNDDASFPVPGTVWPGTGALIAFLSTAYGKAPVYTFGKPSPNGYQMILNHYNLQPEQAVMVGDRLSTDILGANRHGITTVCVETGVHKRKDLEKFSKEYEPDAFIPDLQSLY